MKLLLKDFQTERVAELVEELRFAAREARRGRLQSVSLSSPTGSGKTVMVTAAIELLLQGDGAEPPQEDATFLWITDQPELNEQTRRKMQASSSVLGPSDLVVIDTAFDQETFSPGRVYFLNTQKLGRNSLLVTPGDRRTFTLWDTIRNTVEQRPGRFYVLIDEAHRGMGESSRARNEANSIIQKFIKGSPVEIPAVPLVAGISATPERFHALIQGTPRTERRVVVHPEDVRASGLLKERIRLFHPTEDQPSDITMLRAAAQSWRNFVSHWREYCEQQEEPPVRPVLVVQVQDGTGKQVSRTDLAAAIRNIDEVVGPLPSEAFAHAFQEGASLEVDGRVLRYLPPSQIDGDPDVQVVFFKTSLNTGWDCPRAEVMMSFRSAVDATLIAQLVGRMVRTPLARRVNANEYLNSVALYLPHYDAGGLHNVVSRLASPDPDIMPPVEVEKGEEALTLQRADFVEDVFAALERLPSYVVPRTRKTSEVRRLLKLARLLANDDLDPEAPDKALSILLDVLRTEYETRKASQQFKTIVEEKGKLDVRAVNWRLLGEIEDEDEVVQLDIAAENINDLFDAAGRKFGEGLHKAWWKMRVAEDPAAKVTAKLELFALSLESAVPRTLESAAKQTVGQWLSAHDPGIDSLPEGRQQAYGEIRRLAASPEETPFRLPVSIEGKKADRTWEHHIYVDGRNLFPAKFNTWETPVLQAELARQDAVGWLRNQDRKPWSLCIPYYLSGEWKPLYPDFLFVRQTPTGLTVDLLDPHNPGLEDGPTKAAFLAKYAGDHGHKFGRIETIMVSGDEILRLNLKDEAIRDRVKGVADPQHLRQLFDLFGRG